MKKDYKLHNLRLRKFEKRILPERYKIVAGVDEAGRGPLAGPLVACAVILREFRFVNKIWDSKKLTFSARQRAYAEILKKAHIGLGVVDSQTIDKKNILQATRIAIKKALKGLRPKPQYVLVDGKFQKGLFPYRYCSVVKGDSLSLSIACASIVAKVRRDNLMRRYASFYPQYGFQRNRGYGTAEHLRAIKKYGLTPIHRRSFRPICEELNAVKKFKITRAAQNTKLLSTRNRWR